jgi:hypothetical protein
MFRVKCQLALAMSLEVPEDVERLLKVPLSRHGGSALFFSQHAGPRPDGHFSISRKVE